MRFFASALAAAVARVLLTVSSFWADSNQLVAILEVDLFSALAVLSVWALYNTRRKRCFDAGLSSLSALPAIGSAPRRRSVACGLRHLVLVLPRRFLLLHPGLIK